ncbi:MAG: MFS transporter [Chloroflexota bacterium]|nr:MFS transporter [Chloroflexota bacterium]
MFLILRNARFRLLWASSVVSEMGVMFHITAHGWLTLTVTDSAFWVGASAGVAGTSILVFSTVSGVLADRLNRKYLVLMTLILQASVGAGLATLIFTERIELWHILLASSIEGAMVSIRVPSRLALMMDVAGRPNVQNATAANFAAMTGTGIVIPPIAGLLIEHHGIGWSYAAMSSAFILSSIMLSFLTGVTGASRKGVASPLQDFKEGVIYVFTTPSVRLLILLMLTSEIFGWAHEAMIPVMAREVLDTGPSGVGYMFASGSAGALISALVLSMVGDIRRKGIALAGGYIGFGTFLIMFALSKTPVLSFVLLAASWASVAMYETMLSTLLQTSVPNEMRGRVLSFQTFTWGLSGLSGFQVGAIAALLGAPLAIGIGGGIVLLNGLRLIRTIAIRYRSDQPESASEEIAA